jgi:small RNA 2'-O-methyltransferase
MLATDVSSGPSPMEDLSTPLHEERLDTVANLLLDSGAGTVLDLGCGSGGLLKRLAAEERFTRIVGLDSSLEALRQAERSVKRSMNGKHGAGSERVTLVHGSLTDADADLSGFDAAAMVETIEHIPPGLLSIVERVVFAEWRPSLVVVTTPNREFNVLYGLGEEEHRHPDHRFEWCRVKFSSWVTGVAQRNGFEVECGGIGPADPLLGKPTQVGLFRLRTS